MHKKENSKKKNQPRIGEEPKPKRREKDRKVKYRNHKIWLDNEENDEYPDREDVPNP